ncbi:MAG: SDR family oxidoreductase [Gammaproteobacteria bacterium]|nr:SDR family oxidoreductase [Gammaproteobacteria bacterium]MYD81541.1 SDR family oxidoreductase [Gammaproteobacteria bacterium]
MAGRLSGKIALISGGTSGIGEATSDLFVAEGAKVVLTGRSVEKGRAIADRLGSEKALYLQCDVTDEGDIKHSIDSTVERFGGLDILFNNAGGPTGGGVFDVTPEQLDYAVKLLLTSVMVTTRYAIPHLRKNGGSVINNSSIAGLRYRQGNVVYSVIKAAVTHYSRIAGIELGPMGIRVNTISPGAIATPIFWGGSERANTLPEEENQRKMAKLQRNLAKATPTPRSGLAMDIAEGALYLASDAGSYVNCHDLVVDGGRTSMFYEPS